MDLTSFRNRLRTIRWNDFVRFTDSKNSTKGDYACWAGTNYIKHLAGETDEEYPDVLSDVSEFTDGIYVVFQSAHYEEHHFCLDVDGDNLTVYQTYGGVDIFQKLDFDTQAWLDSYRGVLRGDLDSYNYCFNLNLQSPRPSRGRRGGINIKPNIVEYKKLY